MNLTEDHQIDRTVRMTGVKRSIPYGIQESLQLKHDDNNHYKIKPCTKTFTTHKNS